MCIGLLGVLLLVCLMVPSGCVPRSGEGGPEAAEPVTAAQVRLVNLEVITDQAATGDGGNAWGGHQARIVRTRDGVFTAYTVPGMDDDPTHREWRLVWRKDGAWRVIAQDKVGRDPVNLLAGPDGTLYVISWPGGAGTAWIGKPDGDELEMEKELIPGVAPGFWPYASAGIDSSGALCVLSSTGEKPGFFFWACRQPEDGQWTRQVTRTPYRYCYTYVFPSDGALSLVSTRDVRWRLLGYEQPEGTFDYVFNAFRYWHTDDIAKPMQEMAFVEEPPTEKYPDVRCNAQLDAYIDTEGRMHVLYTLRGESTRGQWQVRHALFSKEGETLYDGKLPGTSGPFCRIFQDSEERYYLLGSAGVLYPVGPDGVTLGKMVRLDLGGHEVEYSGYGISAPRTGTPLSNVVDVVFPSDGGKEWVYFRLELE
jgi:hypothetical protein